MVIIITTTITTINDNNICESLSLSLSIYIYICSVYCMLGVGASGFLIPSAGSAKKSLFTELTELTELCQKRQFIFRGRAVMGARSPGPRVVAAGLAALLPLCTQYNIKCIRRNSLKWVSQARPHYSLFQKFIIIMFEFV